MATRPKPGKPDPSRTDAQQKKSAERLPVAIRRFMVERFACFEQVTAIMEAVRERFGRDLAKTTVYHYDAWHSFHLAEDLRTHAEATRKAYIEESAKAAIANQSFRLDTATQLLRYVMQQKAKNVPLALAILEYAAREMGGAFMRSVLRGEGGEGEALPAVEEMSPQQAAEMLAKRLGAKVLAYPKRKTA